MTGRLGQRLLQLQQLVKFQVAFVIYIANWIVPGHQIQYNGPYCGVVGGGAAGAAGFGPSVFAGSAAIAVSIRFMSSAVTSLFGLNQTTLASGLEMSITIV